VKKNWWKILSLLILIYTIVGGFLMDVPHLFILNESIRNLYFHVCMWFSMMILFGVSVVYSIKYLAGFNLRNDIFAVNFAAVGSFLGILGYATGTIWANYTWVTDQNQSLGSILKEPKLYMAVELKLQSALKNSIEKLQSLENTEKNLNSIEALEYRIKVLRAGLENYGNPKEGLVKYHIANSAYGLKKQKYDFTKFDEESEALDKVENSERFGDVKNLGKSILELADEETVYILKSLFAGSINKETNAIEYEFDELGFKKLADFRNTWNSTVRLIGGVQDPQDMYNKLLGDSKTNAQIKQLIENKAEDKNSGTVKNI
jgi:hypothetical protein